MANLNFRKSPLPLPYEGWDHVAVSVDPAISGIHAVSWKNTTILLDLASAITTGTISSIYLHRRGKWIKQKTSGDVQPHHWNYKPLAHVFNDKMIVMSNPDDTLLHSLDLLTWKWTRLSPNGIQPLKGYRGARSWAHQGKIYFFGDIVEGQATNHLFCYNISTNSWEWPDMEGEVPSPRRRPLVTKSGNTVFLIGGAKFQNGGFESIYYNDLYILDLPTMRWKKVHDNMPTREGFTNHRVEGPYSFTCISPSEAVLIGFDLTVNTLKWVDNCWLLNLDNTKKLMEPSLIWTKITNKYPRFNHAAVMQPLSKRLWLICGLDLNDRPCKDVIKINFKRLGSLKDLSLDSVARDICDRDPRLGVDQVPTQLRDEIEAYKCEIGELYLCPRHASGGQLVNHAKKCIERD